MSIRQADLVKLWRVSRARVSQMVKAGMPLESVAMADAWRMANCGGAGSKIFSNTTSGACGAATPSEQLPEPPAAPTAEELERSDIHGVSARCVQAELEAWRGYYMAIQSGDLNLIGARGRLYRDAAETRIKAETALAEILRKRGETWVRAEVEEYVAKRMEPVALALRTMAAATCHRANPADPQLARAAIQDEVLRIFVMMGRKP